VLPGGKTKRVNPTAIFVLISVAACCFSCASNDEFQNRMDQRNDAYSDYNERRNIWLDARQESTDIWFDRVMH
jgi:hypothetical protein